MKSFKHLVTHLFLILLALIVFYFCYPSNIEIESFLYQSNIFFFLEIARIQRGGKPPGRDSRIVDIYHEKPIRLTVRVVVPVKEHPKFNFVGKLLGPKGNSMKRLQEDTMTKMAVLGKGSMRNKQQVQHP